ncbi:MAG: hypothetical protein AB8C02_10465 [Halioglobus sp.]
MNTQKFDPSEFSSRKLWQFVTEASSEENTSIALTEAVEELATRRQYMEKLLSSDKLARLVPKPVQTKN